MRIHVKKIMWILDEQRLIFWLKQDISKSLELAILFGFRESHLMNGWRIWSHKYCSSKEQPQAKKPAAVLRFRAIFQINHCGCRSWLMSEPIRHLRYDRSAANPGGCGIHDGLPNRRTDRDRDFFSGNGSPIASNATTCSINSIFRPRLMARL